MKRIVSFIMFILVFASFCIFGRVDSEAAATPLPTPEPAKTYTPYSLSSFSFSLPDYYLKLNTTDSQLQFGTSIVDSDAVINVVYRHLDVSEEMYILYADQLTQAILKEFDDSQTLLNEDILVSGMPGKRVQGQLSVGNTPSSFILAHLFDSKNKNVIVVLYGQQNTSRIDYSADVERIIESIHLSSDSSSDAPKAGEVSYNSFQKIKMGMSLNDVKAILGNNTSLAASSEILGIKTEIYSWTGNGFATITITLTNGKVSSRGQVGLNSSTAFITAAQFSKVKKGMTYKQVVAIMGCDGYVSSESSIMGRTMTEYQWDGDGLLSSASITFQNGKVTSMSQYGLS